jgi:hypothetical protein
MFMIAVLKRFAAKQPPVWVRVASAGAALAFVSLGTPAAAETAEERAACRPDVFRLCAGEIPSRNRIVACLMRKRSQLSAACAVVFTPPGEQRSR